MSSLTESSTNPLDRAEAALLADQLSDALGLIEAALADELSPVALVRAIRIGATAHARRGDLNHAAELYRWLGPGRHGSDSGIAASLYILTGDLAAADDALIATYSGLPTEFAAGARLVGEGVLRSLTELPGHTAPDLLRASTMLSRSVCPVPVAALALSLLHAVGDAGRTSNLSRAAAAGPADISFTALTHAWFAVQRGAQGEALSLVDSTAIGGECLREQQLAAGVRVAAARRTGDRILLRDKLFEALDVASQTTVNLLDLPIIGEFALAATILGDPDIAARKVADAQALIERLDDPAAWTSTYHWSAVQASLLSGDADELTRHATCLRSAAESSPADQLSVLFAAAGRASLQVTRGQVDPNEISAVATSLTHAGRAADGIRIASEAALRTTSTTDASALLHLARAIRETSKDRTVASASASPTSQPPTAGPLSEREIEVAALIVRGLTQREIAEQLYISAKTVEHHAARIRRKLDVTSRSELLSQLRVLGIG